MDYDLNFKWASDFRVARPYSQRYPFKLCLVEKEKCRYYNLYNLKQKQNNADIFFIVSCYSEVVQNDESDIPNSETEDNLKLRLQSL